MGRGDVMPVAGGNVTCGYGKCSAGLRDPGTDCRVKRCGRTEFAHELNIRDADVFVGKVRF